MLTETQIEVFQLNPELRRKHYENLKKAWLLKMQEKAFKKWVETKKLDLILAK